MSIEEILAETNRNERSVVPEPRLTRRNWIVSLYAATTLLLLGVTILVKATKIKPQQVMHDPAAVIGFHPFVGLLSNLGVLLWSATAAILLFTASLLWTKRESRETAGFLLGAGLFTVWLTLDDLFLIHEWLLPRYLGVEEGVTQLAYGGLVACLAVRFRTVILAGEFRWLLYALVFLALSAGIDQLPKTGMSWRPPLLLEDSLKLLGIAGWLGYFGATCAGALLDAAAACGELRNATSKPAPREFLAPYSSRRSPKLVSSTEEDERAA